MLINIGRNRTILFIRRTLIFIPSPTGVTIVGVKTIGVAINIPQVLLDFSNQGLLSVDVDAIVADTDSNYVQELTWRVLDLSGNEPITNQINYDNLTDKGFTIYGDTSF